MSIRRAGNCIGKKYTGLEACSDWHILSSLHECKNLHGYADRLFGERAPLRFPVRQGNSRQFRLSGKIPQARQTTCRRL